MQSQERIVGIRIGEKNLIDAIEAEIAHQSLEPGRRARQVQVVPYPVPERHAGHAWLLRIYFPWMEIEHARGLLLPVDATQAAPEQCIGQQTEITATTARPVASDRKSVV